VGRILQVSYGKVSHSILPELLGNATAAQQAAQSNLAKWRVDAGLRSTPEDAWQDQVWLSNDLEDPHIHLHYQLAYTCDEKDYNEAAMLWLNSGVKGAKVRCDDCGDGVLRCDCTLLHGVSSAEDTVCLMLCVHQVLMQRGFPHMISWQCLLTFFGTYFVLASYASGTSVPAGLIIPHLLLGGSGGRAIGLLGCAPPMTGSASRERLLPRTAV
jgi:hypothetical protein